MKIDKKTIDELSEKLINVFDEIYSEHEETDLIQLIYGADDVLVVISFSEEPSPEFQEAIDNGINKTDYLCGYVLSDGPKNYSNYTSAYIRENPENAYEYVLPICSQLGIDTTTSASIFKTAYENTGGEGEDAAITGAAHVYLNIESYDDTNYVEQLSEIIDVEERKLRQAIFKYQKESL